MVRSLLGDVGGVAKRVEDMASGRVAGVRARQDESAQGSEGGEYAPFTENSFDEFNEVSFTDGTFEVLARFFVPAQTGYVWGYSDVSHAPENQGVIFVDLQESTPAAIDGRLRLRSRNAVGKEVEDHGTWHTAELRQVDSSGDPRDRRSWVKLPERNMDVVGEDSELYLEYESQGSNTPSQSDTTIHISTTEFTPS